MQIINKGSNIQYPHPNNRSSHHLIHSQPFCQIEQDTIWFLGDILSTVWFSSKGDKNFPWLVGLIGEVGLIFYLLWKPNVNVSIAATPYCVIFLNCYQAIYTPIMCFEGMNELTLERNVIAQ